MICNPKRVLAPMPKWQFNDADGVPMAGAKFFVYAAGTTTKVQTWTDESGLTPNTNPIILDSRGECSVWVESAQAEPLESLPSGPPGPQGPQGVPGAQGAQGAPGLSNQPTVQFDLGINNIVDLNITPFVILPAPAIDFYYVIDQLIVEGDTGGGQLMSTGGTLALFYGDSSGLSIGMNGGDTTNNVLLGATPRIDAFISNTLKGTGFNTGFANLTDVAGKQVVLTSATQWYPNNSVGPIYKISISNGGSGYAVNDTGTISTGGADATYKVLTVATGVVTKVQLVLPGTGYQSGAGKATATGGSQPGVGTGLTLNVVSVEGMKTKLRGTIYYHTINVILLSGGITGISNFTVGSGYAVGDTGVVNAGNVNATFVVNSVGGGGEVLTYALTYRGSGYVIASSVPTISGGAGTGFTINISAVAP